MYIKEIIKYRDGGTTAFSVILSVLEEEKLTPNIRNVVISIDGGMNGDGQWYLGLKSQNGRIIEDVDIKELWDMFEYYGRIENNGIKIKKVYNDTIAFVNYLNEDSAKKAIEKCDKKKLGYCIINVEMAKFK